MNIHVYTYEYCTGDTVWHNIAGRSGHTLLLPFQRYGNMNYVFGFTHVIMSSKALIF